MTGTCRGCGAEVIWVRAEETRRKMPLDAEPVWIRLQAGGHTFITKGGRTVIGYKIGDAYDTEDPDTNLIEAHESHFATCPKAPQFRNRKPRTRPPGYR